MNEQLDMLVLMRPAPIRRPILADGDVVQGEPHETLRLPHPRRAWPMACIELHQHDGGMWMWGVQHAGGGYKVGPKWGRFAYTRYDALYFAADELIEWAHRSLSRIDTQFLSAAQLRQVIAWAKGLE